MSAKTAPTPAARTAPASSARSAGLGEASVVPPGITAPITSKPKRWAR
ncbi:Uncharacterised protein [Mycobacteroides abscessus subsp. abscessus]|nr:Uncharacterised protein [Mycobacteroides abscessus subsp. abscessus]